MNVSSEAQLAPAQLPGKCHLGCPTESSVRISRNRLRNMGSARHRVAPPLGFDALSLLILRDVARNYSHPVVALPPSAGGDRSLPAPAPPGVVPSDASGGVPARERR